MTEPDTSASFFEAKYKAAEDPWNFASSTSEQQRYAQILRALRGRRFRQGFEPACSIGVLTEMLAPHCDNLVALDLSPTAAARAAERCARFPQVKAFCASVRDVTPPAGINLLILSEIGYYFEPEDWTGLVQSLLEHCDHDCTVIACHWLGQSPDHRASGDAVHDSLRRQPTLHLEHEEWHGSFRLDRFSRVHA